MQIENKTIEQARATDMVAFFEQYHGFTFAHRGGVYRCRQHPSLAVKNDRRSWYWHSKGVGGFGVLDYLVKVEKMPFRGAVEAVAGIPPITPLPPPETEKPRTLILPQKAGMPLRLYDYLCVKRGIDSEVVNTLIQEGKLYEDKRRNVVFIGFDEHGTPRFASLRGTGRDFRCDVAGSDKRYGFNMAFSESAPLYIFESPIDCMSHASMTEDWREQNRLSLAGTSDTAIPFLLNQQKGTRELRFCLDNDPVGRKAAEDMAQKYAEKGFTTRLELPRGKDFNEDLQTRLGQIRAERSPKITHRDVTI